MVLSTAIAPGTALGSSTAGKPCPLSIGLSWSIDKMDGFNGAPEQHRLHETFFEMTHLQTLAQANVELGAESGSVLILPIYDIGAKKWNGEGYSAIFMIDATEKHDLSTVASLTNFHGIKHMSKGTQSFLNSKHWDVINVLQTKLSSTGTVIVPQRLAAADDASDQARVAKITFWSHESGEGHPAPDPLLLSIKAAINWSSFHGQKLLAGGDPPEDVASDDESYIAEQTYLEWRTHVQNEKQKEEILGMRIGHGK
jgi:hypothetical protein